MSLKLSRLALRDIVDVRLREVQERLNDKQITIDIDGHAKAWLATNGYDPVYGARPLNRLIQKKILNPLAMNLIEKAPRVFSLESFNINGTILFYVLKKNGGKIDNKRQGYVEAIRENEKFVTYYKAQNIIPDEDEWNKFMEFNKSNLPTCFRITGFRSHSFELRDLMKTKYFPKINEIQFGDDQKSEAPKPLPWYPDELAWQHLAPRNTIKKDPAFQYFHKWLVAETDAGNISRQEAVSMIPTLLLDVKPHHWVFDMCAAPGSKTSQIIEAIHANDSQEIKIPSGIVIANDADSRRSYMLIHQTKRLRSPCLVVTNHDAAQFPIKILLRGAQLLKENGRIVYSTCTFNPLENEAVIVEVLKRCRGNLELVDVSDQLPQLIRTPDGNWVDKIQDIDKNCQKNYPKSLWPPKDIDEFHLEKCIRVYPHFQNTDKCNLVPPLKELPSVSSSSTDIIKSNIEESSKRTKVEKNKAKSNNNIKKKEIKVEKDDSSSKNSLSGEEPFILLSPDNEEIPIIKNFYGLSDEFPVDQILVRSETEKNKTLYLVSSAVKTLLQAINTQKLRIVNTGVKLFTRHDTYDVVRCNFRCNAEGISTIFPFLSSKRVINLGLKELEILLSEPNPLFSKFDEDVNERIKELVILDNFTD
ncbi:22096_t:CDS:10 [Entrophospora sp. SA101]|nr:22096_t:CDS:10 [Entrophospora sp. SA101]